MGIFSFKRRVIHKAAGMSANAMSRNPAPCRNACCLPYSTKTHPEILYYLARHDPDPQVRLAVAKE